MNVVNIEQKKFVYSESVSEKVNYNSTLSLENTFLEKPQRPF